MSTSSAAPDLRHGVIAGANKCGTTSLFRYLAAHPQVRTSRVKETGFFLSKVADQPDALDVYLQSFGPPDSLGDELLLEATPHYLEMASRVAHRIQALLPRTRLLFLVRDPVERFQSFYRSKQAFLDYDVSQMSTGQFVATAFAEAATLPNDVEELLKATFGRQLLKGRYSIYLRRFLEVFSPTSVRIFYLENLRDRPKDVLADVCRFLDLDPAIYADFEFKVKNRSRKHRYASLRTLASRANRRLEPLLNRAPWIRRTARAVYDVVNTSPIDSSLAFSAADTHRLRAYYEPFNRDLADLVLQLKLADSGPPWNYGQGGHTAGARFRRRLR